MQLVFNESIVLFCAVLKISLMTYKTVMIFPRKVLSLHPLKTE